MVKEARLESREGGERGELSLKGKREGGGWDRLDIRLRGQ